MFLPCAGRVFDLLSDVSKFLNGKVRVLQIHALHWLNFEEPLCDLICSKSRNDLVQLMHSDGHVVNRGGSKLRESTVKVLLLGHLRPVSCLLRVVSNSVNG